MQNHPYTSKAVAAFLVLGLIGAVNAAPIGVGASAAGSVGVGVGGTALPGGSSIGAAFGGGAAGGFGAPAVAGHGSATAGGSLRADGAPTLPANAEAIETIGMRQERLATGVNVAGGQAINAPGMAVANEHALAAVLNAGPAVKTIQETGVDGRAKLESDIETSVNATGKAMSDLKRESKSLNAEQRTEFQAAMKDVDARAKTLKKSLKTARKASAETWGDARADVAANYAAYVEAAQRAEATATAAPVPSTSTAANSTTAASADTK
jgi:hypothetical protein